MHANKMHQKQLVTNESKACHLSIYHTSITILKFNFEPLFIFINFFKYLKHFIQSILKKCAFLFPHFYSNLGMRNVARFCGFALCVNST
jgi:hypothetical protein